MKSCRPLYANDIPSLRRIRIEYAKKILALETSLKTWTGTKKEATHFNLEEPKRIASWLRNEMEKLQ